MKIRALLLTTSIIILVPVAFSQTPKVLPSPVAATAPTVVPALVLYADVAQTSDGKPLVLGSTGGETTAIFLLFRDETGGEPLWVESQHVSLDAGGRYRVQLGAGSPSGLPLTVFASGEARWLEVQMAGQKPQARVLLSSVPYAAKAADAATLGGLPASAFVLAGSQLAATLTAAGISPDAGTTVTTSGGTVNYVPKFTGSATITNSLIFDNGKNVGIGVIPNTSVRLDVGGAMIMRGNMIVSRAGDATSAKGYPSYGFGFYSNAYNSSTKATDNPHFLLQSEPTGNNTASTGATFNLLYSNHGSAPAETGLSINPSGILTFASGQTFPGAGSGGITKITAGTNLTGGGSSGNVTLNVDTTKVPILNGSNTFSDLQRVIGTGIYGLYGSADFNGLNGNASGTSPNASGVYGTGPTGVLGIGSAVGVSGATTQTRGASSLIAGVFAQYGTASNELTDIEGRSTLVAGLVTDGGQTDQTSGESELGMLAVADDSDAGGFFNNSAAFETIYAENDFAGGPLFEVIGGADNEPTCSIDGAADLQCTGYIAGSNVSPFTGRTVLTYDVQSAENWYEDAGSGQLQNGAARIALDRTFGEIVNTSVEYHVFLTPMGESNGLYITNKTAAGFEVRESGHGASTIGFEYRIMAKRKGYEKLRLEDKTEERRQQVARRLIHQPRAASGRSVFEAGSSPLRPTSRN